MSCQKFLSCINVFPRDNLHHDVSGEVQLVRHGTAHVGPIGEKIISSTFRVSLERALKWQEQCDGKTFGCMQGPWLDGGGLALGGGGTLEGSCKGLQPLPIMFNNKSQFYYI